jgi:hypothetical protein
MFGLFDTSGKSKFLQYLFFLAASLKMNALLSDIQIPKIGKTKNAQIKDKNQIELESKINAIK